MNTVWNWLPPPLPPLEASVEFHLGGLYTSMVGTIYGDMASVCPAVVTLQDVSDPATGVKQLFQATVNPSAQATFTIDLHGVQDITIDNLRQYNCGDYNPELVDIVSSLTPQPSGRLSCRKYDPSPGDAGYLSLEAIRGRQHLYADYLLGQAKREPGAHPDIQGDLHQTGVWRSVIYLELRRIPGRGIYQYTIVPLDKYGAALVREASPAIQFTLASNPAHSAPRRMDRSLKKCGHKFCFQRF